MVSLNFVTYACRLVSAGPRPEGGNGALQLGGEAGDVDGPLALLNVGAQVLDGRRLLDVGAGPAGLADQVGQCRLEAWEFRKDMVATTIFMN